MPTLKDENWRYTSLRGIDFDAFATVAGGDARRRATPTVLGDLETAGELVQRGQDVVTCGSTRSCAPQGVVLSSLDGAVETHGELVDRHLGSVLDLRDRFIAENSATWSGGAFVYVPAGVDGRPAAAPRGRDPRGGRAHASGARSWSSRRARS